MDVLSSRALLHPTDPERSRVFYRDTLGLAIYRGPERGTVFFLGGGFLELSGRAASPWHGVVAAGARAGRGATGARRAWRSDLAGAQARAVGAAGDVDRRPGRGAHLHCGGAGGAPAAPPRLTPTSVPPCLPPRRIPFPDVPIRPAGGVTGGPAGAPSTP